MNLYHSQEDFELIERYLSRSLDSELQEELRLKMLSDKDFAARVQEVQELQLGVERAALARKLDSFHSEMSAERKIVPVRKLTTFQFWGVAASFFLLITAGTWWLMGQKSTGKDIYQAYYQADPGLVTSMSGEGNYNFDRAMVDYKSAEYTKAKEAFEGLLKNNSQNDTLIYFLAMAELNLDNNQTAEKLLHTVTQDSSSGFSKDSFWYLGLLAVKEGDYAFAKKHLMQSDRAKAEELIKAIEKEEGK